MGPALLVGDADYVGAFLGIDDTQSSASGVSVHDGGGGLVSHGLHGSVVVPLTSPVSPIGFGAHCVPGGEPGDSPLVRSRGSDEQGLLGVSVAVSLLNRAGELSDMTIKLLAGTALAVSVAACSSSGDTGALLIESAQACGAVCAEHPRIGSIAYEAGGGSPLLFGGKVSVDCECTDAIR